MATVSRAALPAAAARYRAGTCTTGGEPPALPPVITVLDELLAVPPRVEDD